jgi:hypothetical protein
MEKAKGCEGSGFACMNGVGGDDGIAPQNLGDEIKDDEERRKIKGTVAQKLNKLQVEYIQVRSDIMAASKQSVLAKKLEGCGIKEAIVPLKRINTNEQPENTEE